MPRTILDVRNKSFVGAPVFTGMPSVQCGTDNIHNLIIAPFITPSDRIGLSRLGLEKSQFNTPDMIQNIKPIPYVFAITVDGYRFLGQRGPDDGGNQLFT